MFKLEEFTPANSKSKKTMEGALELIDEEPKKPLKSGIMENSIVDPKLEQLLSLIEQKKIEPEDLEKMFDNIQDDNLRINMISALGNFETEKATKLSFKLFHSYIYAFLDKESLFGYDLERDRKEKRYEHSDRTFTQNPKWQKHNPQYILSEIFKHNQSISEDDIISEFKYWEKWKKVDISDKDREQLLIDSLILTKKPTNASGAERMIYVKLLEELSRKSTRKSIDFFIDHIQNNYSLFINCRNKIVEIFKNTDENYATDKILGLVAGEQKNNSTTLWIIFLTDMFGSESIREKIIQLIEKNRKDEKETQNLEYAYSLITPNSDKEAIGNLQEFYQTKIKFEDYKINERMNEKEVALLQELVEKDDAILEMGCGTGRLLVEMAKSGYDVSGYDYTQRHAQITKEKLAENNLEAKVFQGDWHHNALKDESFDAVYSLGRNILHDYSVISQAELFREASLILKDGGKFIFDIPNREKGGYKELVEGYANEMKKRGIENFRYGAIYDSPDGINFATRYAYSSEDISQLAQIAGFEISEIRKEKLETGKEDENIYYVLTKKNKN